MVVMAMVNLGYREEIRIMQQMWPQFSTKFALFNISLKSSNEVRYFISRFFFQCQHLAQFCSEKSTMSLGLENNDSVLISATILTY